MQPRVKTVIITPFSYDRKDIIRYHFFGKFLLLKKRIQKNFDKINILTANKIAVFDFIISNYRPRKSDKIYNTKTIDLLTCIK